MQLTIRLTMESLVDKDELFSWLKANSNRYFWGIHEAEQDDVRPHYHWYIDTKHTDNRIRQEIRKYVTEKGNKAYSVSECKDVNAYGSYVCFKHQTTQYDIHGFDEEVIAEWRFKGSEIIQKVLVKEKIKKDTDYLQMVISRVGCYRYDETHEYNCDVFLKALRDIGKMNTYVQCKLCALFLAWKEHGLKSEYITTYDCDDPSCEKQYRLAKLRIEEHKKQMYSRLWNA